MSKTTLKHQLPSGTIATRQTARNYTHVLVGILNKNKLRATLESKRSKLDARIAKAIEEAEYDYKYYSNLKKVPVGEKFYYHRAQGGAYLNRSGKHMEVSDWNIESAERYTKDGLDGLIARRVSTVREQFADYERDINNILSREHEHEVISWHGRADLAEKAGNQKLHCNLDCHVEEINHGERA